MKSFAATLFAILLMSPLSHATANQINGTITLGKGMIVPPNAVIFIAARPPTGGMPLAVEKLESAKFPLAFKIGQENSMAGGAFSGDVEITVRASQAPNPMSRTPGDLFGTLKTKVGADKVKIVLNHKI